MKRILVLITAFITIGLSIPLAQTAHAGFCESVASGTEGWITCEQEGGESFKNFEGGLSAPSKEGYAPELTQVTSAREFVVKVVNFALGFLGLIAMLIIIYGGVRYVTSAGGTEGVEKGKKSVMYAALGLVIVMGSYAIVNTILKAPSGTDQGATQTALQTETEKTVIFSIEEIKNIPQALVTAYSSYSQNKMDLLALKQGLNQIWLPTGGFNSISDMQSALTNIEIGIQGSKNKLANISNRTSRFSPIQDRITQYEIYMNVWMSNMRNLAADVVKTPECKASEEAECVVGAETVSPIQMQIEVKENCGKICKKKISEFSVKLTASWNALKNYLATGGSLPDGANFMDISYKAIEEDNEKTMDSNIDRIKSALTDLKNSTKMITGVSEDLFKNLESSFDDLKNPDVRKSPELVKQKILSIIETLITLRKNLENVKFVKVYLSADHTEGNAPLIVNFDTRGSEDPAGPSIQDKNIEWDLDGSGEPFNQGEIWTNCKEQSGQVATCIYTKPGTYRTAVKVKSSDEKKIATGIAYITIKVLSPKARIKLHAKIKIGGTVKDVAVMEYDSNGFLITDKPSIQITLTQAKNGIQFDATGTTSTSVMGAGADTLQSIRWDFGDKTDIIEGEPKGNNLSPAHFYNNVGYYNVILEVTDKKGIKDRKVFTVIVSSIAALIDISPEPIGKTGTRFMMSGQNSSSDNGQITKYEWTLAPDIEKLGLIAKPSFMTKFIKPSTYTLTLKVTDSQANEASDNVEIKIESNPPTAKFAYSTPKSTQPAIMQLDGTKTYDPDGPNKDIIYLWTIEAPAADYKFISGDEKTPKILVKFNNLGTYKITLKVNDKNEPGKYTEETKEISITNLLDIEWGDKNTASGSLDDKGEFTANFSAISEHAANYDFDFGDAETESGVPENKKIEVSHAYKKAGVFKIKLTVSDDENNKNSVVRRLIIGGAKNPVAVVKLLVNNEEITDLSDTIEVTRKDVVTFDASNSINIDGSKSNLKYQWDFGDGKKSTKNIATYTYKELTKKQPNTVALKISDASDPTKSATDTFKISVISAKPILKSLIAIPENIELKTPLKVNLSAIEPVDPDGRIISYKWWYFDINNPEDKLGEQLTQTPYTSVVVGTKGNEGDAYKYKFAVAITDDENQESTAEEILGIDSLPILEVINGPNKSPIAKFSVDRTNIKMGESITFSSSSTDPDGKITAYIWDTDGEGFAGKEQTNKASVTIKYDKPYPEGIKVRLKVIDDNFGETISEPVAIYVLSKAYAPKAAFTYTQEEGSKTAKFKNNSTTDEANGAKIEKYIWDFDTMSMYQTADTDGDSIKDNDTDSIETNPSYAYPAFGLFYAKLTVIDSFGGKNSVTNPVSIKSPQKPAAGQQGGGAGGGFGANDMGLDLGGIIPGTDNQSQQGGGQTSKTLSLKVKTTPFPDPKDGKIHMAGAMGTVTFSFSESTGDITSITIDKNIYFDSDNNGIKDDDVNFQTQSKLTPWQTNFESSWGQIAVKFTAIDKNKKQATVFKEIVFDSITKAGLLNVFVVPGSAELYAALASMFGFGILSARALKRRYLKRKK